MLDLLPLILFCGFGLLVIAFFIGFFLLQAGVMIGIPLAIARRGQPILEMDPEGFFKETIPELFRWNADAFDDFSSLLVSRYGTNFKQSRIIGTLKSLRDPEATGWLAFDLTNAWLTKSKLRLRTSEHDLEYSIHFDFPNIEVELSAHQKPIGRLQKKMFLTTIFDVDNREIGTYHIPFQIRFGVKPRYGEIRLHGRNVGTLNTNFFNIYRNFWMPSKSSIKSAFQLKPFAISKDEEVWLLSLLGMLVFLTVYQSLRRW